MKNKPRIVVVGSLVFDFVAMAERLPRKGETLLGRSFGMFPGGKGANQAVQAGRLGADVHLIGRVGADWLGAKLLDSLHESNVQTEHVLKDPEVNTAACCIHVDGEGNNAIVIVPEANAACAPADVDAAAALIQTADVLLCQLEVPLATVARAVELAAGGGVTVILNPAPVQELPYALLNRVDYLTPNEHEAAWLVAETSQTSTSEQWARAV